ncbi:MAG: hypothetical protein Q7K40_04795 [bacterium]|nr:hypothetical protein [bacterium]
MNGTVDTLSELKALVEKVQISDEEIVSMIGRLMKAEEIFTEQQEDQARNLPGLLVITYTV